MCFCESDFHVQNISPVILSILSQYLMRAVPMPPSSSPMLRHRTMSVLVYGCNGSLGSAIVKCLRRSKPAWCIVGVDVAHSTSVHHSIQISPSNAMFPNRQAPELISSLDRALPQTDKKLDAIVCVSGGFTMGSAKAIDSVLWSFSHPTSPSLTPHPLHPLFLAHSLRARARALPPSLPPSLPSALSLALALSCILGADFSDILQAPELLEGVEDMFARSVFPSFISAQLAALYLRPGSQQVSIFPNNTNNNKPKSARISPLEPQHTK
jgi:hypothetical protein